MKNKVCTKCKTKKSVSKFYRLKSHKTGYNSWCKECCNAWGYKYKKRPEVKERENLSKKAYKKTNRTKELNRIRRKERYRKYKIKAVEYKGGKCCRCGYNKCVASLEFHHVDPDKKEAQVSKFFAMNSWNKIKTELDKCVLLCANCHNELHYNE